VNRSRPLNRPSPLARALTALVRHELGLAARRGENVLVTLVVPPALLVFFATAGVVPGIAGRPVDWLLPGALALAIVAAGLVSLGIATAYDRHYGVLKRLGAAPVSRPVVLGARIVALLVLEVAQAVVLLVVAAVVLGWRPGPDVSPTLVVTGLGLGTLAFASLGLLLAGTLRAEATLAVANGLLLALLMLGGMVLPLDHFAPPLEAIGRVLPASALSDLLRVGFGGDGDPLGPLVVLVAWSLLASVAAARTFRWD
jgi:ABC-2 type transport system permease protein